MREAERVLIAGATGELGRRVATALVDAGVPTRVLVRSPGRLGELSGRVEVVVGDALRAASLAPAMEGVSAVFSSVGASVRPALDAGWHGYHAVDVPANRNLIAAAKAAGVGRFVYVAVALNDATRHCAYVDAHEQVVAALVESGLPHSVLRPTGFHSGLAAYLDLARRGRVPLFGDPDARSNPIADEDLADAAVEQLTADELAPEVVLGGPEVMTRRHMIELAFAAHSMKPSILSLSGRAGRLLAALVRPVSPRISDFLRFAVALGEADLVAPARGTRTLAESYKGEVLRRVGRRAY
jgi:uncharacterized protein YbjT (DUF2867 family)